MIQSWFPTILNTPGEYHTDVMMSLESTVSCCQLQKRLDSLHTGNLKLQITS